MIIVMNLRTNPSKSAQVLSGPAWAAVLVLVFIAAAAAIRRIVVLVAPPVAHSIQQVAQMDAAFSSRKALTLAHIVPALLFVVLVPIWFMSIRRSNSSLNRRVTYALFVVGTVVGVTAFLLSLHPFGGVNEAAAAFLYDGLFFLSLGRAWFLFMQKRESLSRTWMMRAIAVLLGIATTRPVMGVFFETQAITHLRPAQFFGTAFWIGFTVTYIAGEAYLRSHPVEPAPQLVVS